MKIDKNIPMPPNNKTDGLCATMRKMKIGDSILLPNRKSYGGIHTSGKQSGIKVSTRHEGDGFRVWRVA